MPVVHKLKGFAFRLTARYANRIKYQNGLCYQGMQEHCFL